MTRTPSRRLVTLTACSFVLLASMAEAANIRPRTARMRQAEVITELNANGQDLEARYSRMIEQLVGELKSRVPAMNETSKDALVAAVKALAEATNNLRHAENRLAGNQRALSGAGVRAAELDLTVAPVILAAREEMLEWARSLPDSREDKADRISFAEGQISNRTRDLENAPANLERALN